MAFPVACINAVQSRPRTAAPAFVGPLDTLIAQGAVLRHASSVRRLLGSYTGPACKLRGNGIGTLEDISYLSDGALDLAAAAALAAADGGTQALWHTAYDQAEIVDAVQTTDANQMEFGVANQDKGEMGGAATTSRWLNLDLGTITQPTFFCVVVNVGSVAATKVILGSSASAANRFLRLLASGPASQQNWGASLTGIISIVVGKHLFGFLSNGASSKTFINGVLDTTGDAGNTQLAMSGGRIGSSSGSTSNWTSAAGNTISEVIIFDGDPTGLAGWADFVTAQKAYFGVA